MRRIEPPMATPRMAAGVLFRDAEGRVLLVKPSYKAGWDIPGGYVEPGESPKQAARREVLEELGIEVPVGRLLVVKVLFIFDGGQLENRSLSSPAPDEIDEVKFWTEGDFPRLLPARLRDRIASALRANGADIYLEHGFSADGPLATTARNK